MAKIVVVTSGKGGVGKTTTSASFASGLALRGHKTAVIDFDVGLRNLDLIMGCERRVVYDLINVIQGEANLNQALIKDKQCDNLFVLAASQTRDKEALHREGVRKVLDDLTEMGFEYIVCDSPAGIETGALMAMHYADEALVVTNPEVSSVRDSDRILGMLASKTQRAIDGKDPVKEHLLITRYNPSRVDQGQMLSLEDIQDILRIPLIGVIPESENVLTASNQGTPAVHLKGTDVSEAYQDVVARFLGEERPLRFVDAQNPASSSACSGASKPCHCFPSCWARRKRPPASPRSGCRSSWPMSGPGATRPSRTTCPPCSATCGGDQQIHQDQPQRHQGPDGPPGQPGGARSQDRAAGLALKALVFAIVSIASHAAFTRATGPKRP
jgi:septum site-determining protein MinD